MSSEPSVILSQEDGAAVLTLNRPQRLNSFTVAMHEEMQAALATVETDDGIRAVLLTGAGRGFCAGQDLNDRAVSPGGEAVDLGHSCETYWNPMVRRLAELPKPVVCAVNGVAAGAGANLALACDIVFAARSAKFIQSFAHIGLIPDSGGTWVLPRLIGQARAMGIALTGAPVSAEQAEQWGMIFQVSDDQTLMDDAMRLVKQFAAGPTRGLALTKARIRASALNTLAQELDLERDAMRELGYSTDYAEGVAAFLEKRKPQFTGK
ncbi:MAG: 2-(1,2-epoxy-1,2-dihydrophenyl)acetyl-CoA isomerase PaaG [Pseudomonadota bacterium]